MNTPRVLAYVTFRGGVQQVRAVEGASSGRRSSGQHAFDVSARAPFVVSVVLVLPWRDPHTAAQKKKKKIEKEKWSTAKSSKSLVSAFFSRCARWRTVVMLPFVVDRLETEVLSIQVRYPHPCTRHNVYVCWTTRLIYSRISRLLHDIIMYRYLLNYYCSAVIANEYVWKILARTSRDDGCCSYLKRPVACLRVNMNSIVSKHFVFKLM